MKVEDVIYGIIANHVIAIYSSLMTDQLLSILVADLPSSTFAFRLANHPGEQTSLTN
jgi:hypothetical protein